MTRTTSKTKLMLPVKHLLSVQSRRQDARTTSWELSFSRWLKNCPCWPKISECPGSQRCRVWWRKTGSESCQTTWSRRDRVRLCTPAHPRCGPGPAGSASARWRWWSWVRILIMDQARYKLSSHWLTQFTRFWLVATILYSLLIGWYNYILTFDWLTGAWTVFLSEARCGCSSQSGQHLQGTGARHPRLHSTWAWLPGRLGWPGGPPPQRVSHCEEESGQLSQGPGLGEADWCCDQLDLQESLWCCLPGNIRQYLMNNRIILICFSCGAPMLRRKHHLLIRASIISWPVFTPVLSQLTEDSLVVVTSQHATNYWRVKENLR